MVPPEHILRQRQGKGATHYIPALRIHFLLGDVDEI